MTELEEKRAVVKQINSIRNEILPKDFKRILITEEGSEEINEKMSLEKLHVALVEASKLTLIEEESRRDRKEWYNLIRLHNVPRTDIEIFGEAVDKIFSEIIKVTKFDIFAEKVFKFFDRTL